MISTERMFRAVADATRLRILHLLAKRELCVCDLVAVLGAPQPKISRHLAYLKRAGLIGARREGPWRHYSLERPTGVFHRRLIGCVRSCLDGSPAFKRDAKSLSRVTSRSGRCAGAP